MSACDTKEKTRVRDHACLRHLSPTCTKAADEMQLIVQCMHCCGVLLHTIVVYWLHAMCVLLNMYQE
jgi:hypothetical protein